MAGSCNMWVLLAVGTEAARAQTKELASGRCWSLSAHLAGTRFGAGTRWPELAPKLVLGGLRERRRSCSIGRRKLGSSFEFAVGEKEIWMRDSIPVGDLNDGIGLGFTSWLLKIV